ncbi:MAG: UDP-N-acetylmuramoyl-tripeptide--D-alanyl-D-alanine ligase [Candidatus Margulisbacteria bacterium]|nr:UDP-N-acetylmuramoyl-tripeptide--D-alanyl-D-alanine ligase [Candidatus Margulisiibacteriota bacterium]
MFTIKEIMKVIAGARVMGQGSRRIRQISIDSRTVKPGELFIPIKGPKFDGRKFIPAALKKGALILDVKDGLKALQALAAYHRSKFKIPVIGVTGSVGKTTTKDMIASVLSQALPTLKNEENYNNEVGVPLTLLKLTKKHKAVVIEMAMQGLGEIELLAKIVRPTIAVVTNIGESHLEFLKTTKNIAKAKSEIFQYLRKGDYAVINQDDEYFEHLNSKVKSQKSKIMTFGIIEKADITPKELKGIELPIPGEHNIYNALAAVAVAKILKLKKEQIKRGLEKFKPSSKRMEVINRKDRVKIINDTYNASPQSMRAALRLMEAIGCDNCRKIAVLGDMLELGKTAKAAHQKIVRLAKELKVDKVFAFGQLWPKNITAEKSKKVLIKKLKKFIRPRDIILVKGSRGMRMEEVVDALR